jgi:hypothetical protein
LCRLHGIVGVPKDPQAQRVHVPVRRLDELLPGPLVAALTAFDELGRNGLGIVPVLVMTLH